MFNLRVLLLVLVASLSVGYSCAKKSSSKSGENADNSASPAPLDARVSLPEVEQTRRGLDRAWELPEYDPDPVHDDVYGTYHQAIPAQGADHSNKGTQGPGDAHRSFSIGYPNKGSLVGGKALAHTGKHHRVLPRTIKRGYFWATDQVIDLVLHAAEQVVRHYPNTKLNVGNLSSARGGRITTSASHQSGRDVDLGLFCTDLDEQPANPDGFPVFDGSRGERVDRSGQYLIDVPRNWVLLEALLSAPGSRVQWIFLDTPIKRMLLDYAIRNQRDPAIIQMAEKVIMRPKDSSSHNDHFHVRVFCSKRDLNGISSALRCKEYGPDWQWEQRGRVDDETQVNSQVEAIMDGDASILKLPDTPPKKDSPKKTPTVAPPEPAQSPTTKLKDLPTAIDIQI